MTWIKTKDAVPDEDTRYANTKAVSVLCAKKISGIPFISVYYFDQKIFTTSSFGARGVVVESQKVVRWQPLPEMPIFPKKKDDEKS